MQQQSQPSNTDGNAATGAPVQKMAENPNPRANENIKHTPFEEKEEAAPGDDVGTEITDGEGG